MSFRSSSGLQAGIVLGDVYRITRRLAEGGMGTVYEAEHLRLGRRCAVKIMAPELAASTEALARFHREVEITAKLAHPHVVHVFDVGRVASGEPYLVMEYLEGEDLARRLRRAGRLPIATALNITHQIGAALTATHARGIVHRDLKPANIFLLDVEGIPDFVKVVDFGISKMPRKSSKLTRASAIMGTPEYMAPEQANGKVDAIDHRTDQWALAAILWEMLAGRPPFVARELSALLFKIVHDPPGPLHDGSAGPAITALESVLRKALSKKQNDRFPTVKALLRAIDNAVATAPATATDEALPALVPPPRESSWSKPTRWAAIDPARMMRTLHIARLPRRRWWWLVALPALAAAAAWALTTPNPTLPWVSPDRANASPPDAAAPPVSVEPLPAPEAAPPPSTPAPKAKARHRPRN
jgi:eukaryotic-like serine/threonine-protein kinase